MIPERNGRQEIYRVSFSETVSKQIARAIDRASAMGIKQEAIEALKTIDARLRKDPLQLGELYQSFKSLHLLLHVAVVQPIVVHFANSPR